MAKKEKLSLEELLEQALVKDEDQPYEVPGNWIWTRLNGVSVFERGITFPASAKNHEDGINLIPCIRTANIQEELELDDLLYIDRSFMKNNVNKLLENDDILMSSANSRELVGKVSYVEKLSKEMTFGGFVLNIRAKKISSKFLFYYLRLEFLSGNFMGESTQTTNIANINSKILGNYLIPLPPLPEQQRIVTVIESLFEKLDRAKELIQNALDSFENRKSAILHKAFTGELANIENTRGVEDIISKLLQEKERQVREKLIQKPKKISPILSDEEPCEIPPKWEKVKIGEIAFVTKLAGFEYTKYIHLKENGEIPVIRAQNVRRGFLDTRNLLYIDKEVSNILNRSVLNKKCLLITFIGAGIGDVALFNKEERYHLAPNVAKIEIYNGKQTHVMEESIF